MGEVYVTDDGAETTSTSATTSASSTAPSPRSTTSRPAGSTSPSSQGAPRRSTSLDGAGDPPHHRQIKAAIPPSRPDHDVVITRNRRHVGDIESLPSSRRSAVPPGSRPRQHAVHPPHPRPPTIAATARAQDQADAAFRARADEIGIQRYLVCRTERPLSEDIKRKDRPVLQRGLRLRGGGPDVRSSYEIPLKLHGPGSTRSVPPPGTRHQRARPAGLGGDGGSASCTPANGSRSRSWASTRSSPTSYKEHPRGAGPRRPPNDRRGGRGLDRLRTASPTRRRPASCSPPTMGSSCPALRGAGGGRNGGSQPLGARAQSCRSSASASGCRRRSSSSDGRSATSPNTKRVEPLQNRLIALNRSHRWGCCRPSVRTR